jgi:hypothetical protein
MPGGTAQFSRGRAPMRTGAGRFTPRGLWNGVPGYGGGSRVRSLQSTARFLLSDGLGNTSFVTRDNADAPLANCVVDLFETATDLLVATTTSDGSGVFSFVVPNNAGFFYTVGYKVGSPDLAGASVNTLVAVQG